MPNTVFIARIFIPNPIDGDEVIYKPVFAPNSELALKVTEEHYKDVELKGIKIEEPIRYIKSKK